MNDLFDVCYPNHAAAPTSVSANESIAKMKGELRQGVYRFIKAKADGVTCEEIEAGCGLKHQTASARVSELLRDGLIRDSGRRRQTSSGRPARVLCV